MPGCTRYILGFSLLLDDDDDDGGLVVGAVGQLRNRSVHGFVEGRDAVSAMMSVSRFELSYAYGEVRPCMSLVVKVWA